MPQEIAEPGTGSIEPGAIIAGKYRVEHVVGKGGMGIVLAARHTELDQLVAIKLLRPGAASGEVASARFLREARAAARIQSDHAARVFDVGTLDSGHTYMVMEHLDGADLEAVLASRGPLPIDEAVDHVLEALEAVAQAHSHGIIHRDLKPANLFLARLPDGSHRIKVLDFGISKTISPSGVDAAPGTLTEAGAIVGTPLYMSPEQLKSSKTLDVRSDIWSIGVILFELIAGTPPFNGHTVGEIFAAILDEPPEKLRARRPSTPPDLEEIVARCLTRNRAIRYADVGTLALALAPFGSKRTAALPAKIAQIIGSNEEVPATTSALPFESSLASRLDRENLNTQEVLSIGERPAAAKKSGRLAEGAQTGSTWSGRLPGRGGAKRWIMPVAALGCGLLIGLFVAWRASHPATTAALLGGSAEALPARPPEPALPAITPVVPGTALAQSALVAPSLSVPTGEPAPPRVDGKAPGSVEVRSLPPRGPSAPVAPPRASAKPTAPKKSPAELMKERD